MGWAKLLTDMATTPVRIGLAAAGAGVEVANAALDIAKRSLGDITVPSPKESVVHVLGLDETVERATRLGELLAEDAVVERIHLLLGDGGLVDRLAAQDGPLAQLAAVHGALDRLTPALRELTTTTAMLRTAVAALGGEDADRQP